MTSELSTVSNQSITWLIENNPQSNSIKSYLLNHLNVEKFLLRSPELFPLLHILKRQKNAIAALLRQCCNIQRQSKTSHSHCK